MSGSEKALPAYQGFFFGHRSQLVAKPQKKWAKILATGTLGQGLVAKLVAIL
jgi:hypothetical protein